MLNIFGKLNAIIMFETFMIIPKDINSFISTFPSETQKLLQQVRETIQKAAPEAE